MKIYDISMTIDENIPVYNNKKEKKPEFHIRATHELNHYHESSIAFDLHTGTHIDAPLHMIPNGETMSIYKLEDFITKCKVLDFTNLESSITRNDLISKEINEGDFILFKTKNSFTNQFSEQFTFLDKEGATYLVENRIKGVGTDGLGIERSQPNHETHKKLLEKKIMIVEGLRLKDIKEGLYTLIILPLKIISNEAAPARAILIAEK